MSQVHAFALALEQPVCLPSLVRTLKQPVIGMSEPSDRKIYAPRRHVSACSPAPNSSFNCSLVTSSSGARPAPVQRVARPVTGRLTLGAVVVRQRGVAAAGRIHDSDLPGQVLIPRLGNQLLHPDRHHCCSHLPEARNTGLRGHPGGYEDP